MIAFEMPEQRKFRCDDCGRRKPEHLAVVNGLKVSCRACEKKRKRNERRRLAGKPG